MNGHYGEVLTALEAAALLRITEDGRSDAAVLQVLGRIVAKGKLHPIIIGGKRHYTFEELQRFLRVETENYQPTRRGKS